MHKPKQSALHRLREPTQARRIGHFSGCRCRHVQARLQDSGLYTDYAALLPQSSSEVLGLMRKHIELKKVEAQEGIEYRLSWHGEAPVIQELRPRPAGRPLREIMHIQAAAQHRRLMEQAAQEPSGSSLPAAPTQGQAAWQGRREAQHAWQPAGLACHAASRLC